MTYFLIILDHFSNCPQFKHYTCVYNSIFVWWNNVCAHRNSFNTTFHSDRAITLSTCHLQLLSCASIIFCKACRASFSKLPIRSVKSSLKLNDSHTSPSLSLLNLLRQNRLVRCLTGLGLLLTNLLSPKNSSFLPIYFSRN